MALANVVTGLGCGNAAERQTGTNSPGCGLNAPRNADTLKVRFGSWFPQKTQLPGKRVLRKLVYPLKPTPENVGFFVSGHYLTPFRPSLEDPGSKYPFTVSAFCLFKNPSTRTNGSYSDLITGSELSWLAITEDFSVLWIFAWMEFEMSPFRGSDLKSVLSVGFDLAFDLPPAKRVLSFDLEVLLCSLILQAESFFSLLRYVFTLLEYH